MSLNINNAGRPIPAWGAPAQAKNSSNNNAVDTTQSNSPAYVDSDQRTKNSLRASFAAKFGALAGNKAKFHEFAAKTFGSGYDRGKAEQIRNAAARGDYSWLPKVEFMAREQLNGANGAYSAKKGTIYLAGDLRDKPALAAKTFNEEVGHHIDSKINKNDAPGDEGEIFRRLLDGEKLSASKLQELRSENDHGVINVNGEKVEVEYFFKKIKRAFKKVGRGVSRVFKKVTRGVGRVVGGVVGGAKRVFSKITRGVGQVFKKVISFPKQILGNVGRIFRKVAGPVFQVFNAIRNVASRILGNVFRLPAQLLKSTGLSKIFGSVANIARNLMGNVFGNFGKFAFGAISNVINLFKGSAA